MSAPETNGQGVNGHPVVSRLGPLLCWAIVFADIGTSVYYVPGILYGQYGRLAGFFVFLTLSVFVLLTLKYAEVTERFPEGGGVVTVASRALHPWVGALGGMLILVDYFLTAAISSLSGLQYFQVVAPGVAPFLLVLTILVLVVLGVLNWWGIRESATVSAVVAIVALVSDLVVLLLIVIKVPLPTIGAVFHEVFAGRHLTGGVLLTGFAGSFLAFSGLESISQLSPVMRVPRRRVAGWALMLVVVTVGITSPLLTIFSTTLLCHSAGQDQGGLLTCLPVHGKEALDPSQFISLLGGAYGGPWLGVAVAVSASALLVFASNTAIIGSYHVFLALTHMKFFPPIVGRFNELRHTPHIAIGLATGIPIAVLVLVRGDINLLGDMYAFGLLGAFSLTCLALDIVRWRERRGSVRIGPTRAEEEHELREQQHADQLQQRKRAERRIGKERSGHAPNAPTGPLAPWIVRAQDGIASLEPWIARGREQLVDRRQQLVLQVSQLRARAPDLRQWPAVARLIPPRPAPSAAGAFAPAIKVHGVWPTTKFVLGILTTVLVILAWGTNLYNKHLATEFGLSVTAAGMLIALVYQQRLERAGRPHVFPVGALGRVPHAVLVVLPSGSTEDARAARAAVVRTACERAGGRPLIFLYVAPATPTPPLRLLEFADRYLRDTEAQEAFSQAATICRRQGVARGNRLFVYREGGPAQVAEVWRIARPEETIGLAGQRLAGTVPPAYVRMHDVDGLRVAAYIHHTRLGGNGGSAGSATTRPASGERALGPR
jgi:amino acid transporter